jgi:anti-sigma regulatory factor (Ser/Thr protein kinase)
MHRCPVEDKLADIGRAVAWADNLAAQSAIGEDMRFAMQVCLEEALANVVLHGRVPVGPKDIVIEFEQRARGAALIVTDNCLPFDATAGQASSPVQSDANGGRGLRLLHAFSTRLYYRRDGEKNVLEMIFEPPA